MDGNEASLWIPSFLAMKTVCTGLEPLLVKFSYEWVWLESQICGRAGGCNALVTY